MSDLIFPADLSGYAWDSKKKPLFNNITQSPVTGRDVRISLYNQPVYEFALTNNWLTQADKNTLMSFFVARKGSFDSFLYADEDSVITAQAFATGNGVATTFQLAKVTNGVIETVNNPAANPLIYIDGVLKTRGTHYAANTTGKIVFVSPPANNAVISWSGTAYYRCVFIDDGLEYNQFANRLYDCDEIKFKGSLAEKMGVPTPIPAPTGDERWVSRSGDNIAYNGVTLAIAWARFLSVYSNGATSQSVIGLAAADRVTFYGSSIGGSELTDRGYWQGSAGAAGWIE